MFAALGNDLTASKAFTSLSLFSVLRMPLIFIPFIVTSLASSLASLERLKDLFLAEEVILAPRAKHRIRRSSGPDTMIYLEGSYTWGRTIKETSDSKANNDDEKNTKKGTNETDAKSDQLTNQHDDPDNPTLQNISLEITSGEYICVVGKTGQGKSSLLAAMLGEITPCEKKKSVQFFSTDRFPISTKK